LLLKTGVAELEYGEIFIIKHEKLKNIKDELKMYFG